MTAILWCHGRAGFILLLAGYPLRGKSSACACGVFKIYTIILLKSVGRPMSVGVSKLQDAILSRSSREMSQMVRID